MDALREHLDSFILNRTTSKHIDYGKKTSLNDEKDVTMLSETLIEWIHNLWTPYQPLVNLATGKEAPKEMVDNVKSIKQRGEKAMNEFISRFARHITIALQNKKSFLSLKTAIKRIQLLQKRKISLLVKCYHVVTTPL